MWPPGGSRDLFSTIARMLIVCLVGTRFHPQHRGVINDTNVDAHYHVIISVGLASDQSSGKGPAQNKPDYDYDS